MNTLPPTEPDRWSWKMQYCKDRGVPPANPAIWEEAERAWLARTAPAADPPSTCRTCRPQPIAQPVKPLTDRINLYLRNLSPHMRGRLGVLLLDEAESRLKNLEETERRYQELIMLVGQKVEGETRHQTAARYITQAETISSADQSAISPHRPTIPKTTDPVPPS